MKGFQTFPFTLNSAAYSASGNSVLTFDALPATILGGIAHVASIDFHVTATPTDAGGVTLTPLELMGAVNRLVIRDGINERYNGSFALLRFAEILQKGRLVSPDPDTLATTETGGFVRRWVPGAIDFEGDPSDALLPVAALKSGAIELGFNSLDGIDTGLDSLALTVRATVNLVPLYGEFRIPPLFKWSYGGTAAADMNIPGKALHHTFALFNDSAYGAWAAGDIGSVTLTGAAGVLGNAVPAYDLTRSFLATKGGGHLTPVQGEPLAATDDNAKVVNPGTPTALVAATANVNPVLFYSPGQRITKLRAYSESQLRVQWSGSQATARWVSGRIEAQAQAARVAMAQKVLSVLGREAEKVEIKTLSKAPYAGDMADFMPFTVKLKK